MLRVTTTRTADGHLLGVAHVAADTIDSPITNLLYSHMFSSKVKSITLDLANGQRKRYERVNPTK